MIDLVIGATSPGSTRLFVTTGWLADWLDYQIRQTVDWTEAWVLDSPPPPWPGIIALLLLYNIQIERKRYFPILNYILCAQCISQLIARRLYLQNNCLYCWYFEVWVVGVRCIILWGDCWCCHVLFDVGASCQPVPSAVNSPLTLLHRWVCLRPPASLSPGSRC